MRHAPNDLRQVYCAPATQWRNRMLALCVLFLIPPCLYSQGDEGLKARFLREAPAKWDAYKIRARKLQGEYRLTATELQPKLLKSVRVDTFKQSSSAAVYHRGVSQVLEGKAPPTTMPEMVWGQNAKYSFELTRGAPGKPWVAASLELGNKKALKNLGTPVEDWVLTLVTQQFRGGLPIPIGEAVREKEFLVTKAAPVSDGDDSLVEVHFDYKRVVSGDPRSYSGRVILDPARYWHITKAILTTRTKTLADRYEVTYEFATLPGDFPVTKRSIGKVEGNIEEAGLQVFNRLVEWRLRKDEAPPEKEFKLSAFGLPEPLDMSYTDSPHYFAWFFGIGLACFGTAGLCAYLRNRRSGDHARTQ